ncbi:hypothetical protein DPMN_010044 [Dreissena polymorpha]|uniref:Uncharacterized protein n=1 Tax=Dreissena polymorpha TaxID=45954 RepID=A0A9D4N1C1_DREPO|nr:hypothetical protein DPMN_010044 [Dreissena polymorpha]
MDNTISIIEGTSAYSRPPTTFFHPTTAAYSDSIVTAEDSTFILSKDSTNPQSAPSTTSSLHNALTGTSVLPTTLSKIFSSQFPSMVPTSFTILPSFNVPTGIDTFTSLIPSDVSTPNVTSLKSSLSELSSSFTTPPSYFATIYIETSSSIFTSTSILTPTPTQVLPTTANASTASEETWVKTGMLFIKVPRFCFNHLDLIIILPGNSVSSNLEYF